MSFTTGQKVVFKGDEDKEVYRVLSVWSSSVEIENDDNYYEAIPAKVLELAPKTKEYGRGSLILDSEGDYWLSGPEGLWEYITIDSSVSDHRVEEGLNFDQTIEKVIENHGPIRDVYIAPVD
jgi:ligand-binding sensor domain-containing protein